MALLKRRGSRKPILIPPDDDRLPDAPRRRGRASRPEAGETHPGDAAVWAEGGRSLMGTPALWQEWYRRFGAQPVPYQDLVEIMPHENIKVLVASLRWIAGRRQRFTSGGTTWFVSECEPGNILKLAPRAFRLRIVRDLGELDAKDAGDDE